MKKKIHTIVTGLALLLAAGYAATGALMAQGQKNKTGFELSFHHIALNARIRRGYADEPGSDH